jgi:tRNA threonylcarbamoyladenosine biosynthesis protein TsaE
MFEPFVFEASNEQETARFGRALADCLPNACVVALKGTLGAGKTRLVQALAEALGVDRQDVVSPTFVLVQEYHGSRSIIHIDAYRLRGEDEFRQLGGEEYLVGPYVVLIEWADRVSGSLPDDYLEISIDVTGDTQRQFTVTPFGSQAQGVASRLRDELSSR